MQRSKLMEAQKRTPNRAMSRRDRKLALIQDVDRLKKKLKHEENVHRALERAFTRPLGTLPRLPPYLPPYILELLAEVAVLEEEVVRLEEQLVIFRKGLQQEAVNISSSKNDVEILSNSFEIGVMKTPTLTPTKDETQNVVQYEFNSIMFPSNLVTEEGQGKENQSCVSPMKNKQQSPNQKLQTVRTPANRLPTEKRSREKRSDPSKSQLHCRTNSQDNMEAKNLTLQDERLSGDDNPNATSESILKCLLSIFLRMGTSRIRLSFDKFPALSSQQGSGNSQLQDPYCIFVESEKRDIGPYRNLCSIDARLMDRNKALSSLFLVRRLKILLAKLASVKVQKLTHQEKLAFWINVYNSCMMNAFLEHGIPESPDSVVALMQKAKINVGGHLLNSLTIEHFILRLPYHSKHTFSKEAKNNETVARSVFGLELSEPLVTFALCCGSWSSPAVRVFTASGVEHELEAAKKEYLQASVGIVKGKKLAIPKLLDWYLLDFAKDMESLADWICLQLPNELRKEAMKCLERSKDKAVSEILHIMPYDFSFRYLLPR